ncbi:hypothetical protein AAF463_24660 (plasmid) [Pantoea sp. BJ2]|uniref:Uncharacterized protein n=1 Tax=Pantoea sp. BJ2 TaxID=3141322 RepID=A0AAU7U3F7_9GAMM
MKRIISLLIAFTFFGGWYTFPYILNLMAYSCVEQSIVVYDEPDQTVITDARWLTSDGRKHISYSSTIYRFIDGKLTDRVNSERTFEFGFTYMPSFTEVNTLDAFRISGPETSAVWPGAYIDPAAEKNFSAGVYLFSTGQSILTGLKDRPRGICYRSL